MKVNRIGFTALFVVVACMAARISQAEVVSRFDQSKSFYQEGNLSSALSSFQLLLANDRTSIGAAEANYWIGLCLERLSRSEDALASFQAQVTQFPTNRKSCVALLKIGQYHLDKKQYDQALIEFNRALSSYPTQALEIEFRIGECNRVQGKNAEAIVALNNGLATVTGKAFADEYYLKASILLLAECYRATRKWDEAIASYQTFASYYPDEAADRSFDIASILMEKGDYQGAIIRLQTAKSQYPSASVKAQLKVAECYEAEKKYAQAIAALRGASSSVSAGPQDNSTLTAVKSKLGELYLTTKNYDDGITVYQELVENCPRDAGYNSLNLATCYAGKGNYEKAIEICDSAALDHPTVAKEALMKACDLLGEQGKTNDELTRLNQLYTDRQELREEVLIRRAVVRSDEKIEFQAAIDDLQELTTNYPSSWHIPFAKARIIGLTLHGLQNAAAGRALAMQFMVDYPDYEQMNFIKGDIASSYCLEGNWLEAAKWYQVALECPGYDEYRPFTLYLIGSCYQQGCETDNARKTWRKLAELYPSDVWGKLASAQLCHLEAE